MTLSIVSDRLDNRPLMRSISMRIFSALAQGHAKHRDFPTHSDDQELWLTFLADTGVITRSETYQSLRKSDHVHIVRFHLWRTLLVNAENLFSKTFLHFSF